MLDNDINSNTFYLVFYAYQNMNKRSMDMFHLPTLNLYFGPEYVISSPLNIIIGNINCILINVQVERLFVTIVVNIIAVPFPLANIEHVSWFCYSNDNPI